MREILSIDEPTPLSQVVCWSNDYGAHIIQIELLDLAIICSYIKPELLKFIIYAVFMNFLI